MRIIKTLGIKAVRKNKPGAVVLKAPEQPKGYRLQQQTDNFENQKCITYDEFFEMHKQASTLIAPVTNVKAVGAPNLSYIMYMQMREAYTRVFNAQIKQYELKSIRGKNDLYMSIYIEK